MEAKKKQDFSKMSDSELKKEWANAQEALFKLRFQKVVEEVTDITVIRKNKRKIARINTILRLREIKKANTPQPQ